MALRQARTEAGGEGEISGGARTIDLAEAGCALATCDLQGRVVGCSPLARHLLSRTGTRFEQFPAPLPADLWTLLDSRALGEAVQWRLNESDDLLLGCTRHHLGTSHWLLLMSEISHKQKMISQRLHQQRLEALGRLVATTAHDLRSPLSSIVFNIDVLEARLHELPIERVREAAGDIKTAASQLRSTIDYLLDYVRMGPARVSEVTMAEVLARLQSLLRPTLRGGSHRIIDRVSAQGDRVVGNLIAIEQIFVNLVLNSIEAASGPVTVEISASREGSLLRVLVEDDGPGIPGEHVHQVFAPFFTTKRDGTGLGLSTAREAARSVGGDLHLVRESGGAAFAVLLPAAPGAPS